MGPRQRVPHEPEHQAVAHGCIGRETFERLIDPTATYDYAATDVVIPHPTYARQRWIAIVNPSPATFESTIKPLLQEAYDHVK